MILDTKSCSVCHTRTNLVCRKEITNHGNDHWYDRVKKSQALSVVKASPRTHPVILGPLGSVCVCLLEDAEQGVALSFVFLTKNISKYGTLIYHRVIFTTAYMHVSPC